MTTKQVDPPPATPAPGADRSGFIADLAFTLVVPWLVLWRIELFAAQTRSIWTGWWPALMVGVLLAVALFVGRSQRSPRGFLPYQLRWVLLTAILVLPAWICLSIVDAATMRPRMQTGAVAVRHDVEKALASSPPDKRQELHEALAATENADKLAEVIEQADLAQIATPQAALDAPLDGHSAEPDLQHEAEKTIGLAQALESGQPLTGEFAEMTEEAGLDEKKILAALLVLAAALLAPLLGLSPTVTLMLLQTLVADGELSVTGALRVAYAMHDSMLPDGTFDEDKLVADFDRFDVVMEEAQKIAKTVKQAGGRSPGTEALEHAVRPTRPHDDCLKHLDVSSDDRLPKTIEEDLRRRCPAANPDEIRAAAIELAGGSR